MSQQYQPYQWQKGGEILKIVYVFLCWTAYKSQQIEFSDGQKLKCQVCVVYA